MAKKAKKAKSKPKSKPKAKKAAKKTTRPKAAKARKAAVKAKPVFKKKPVKAAKPVQPVVRLAGAANLLVTYDPNHRGIAEAELKEAFMRLGERYELTETGVEGLFKLKTQDARRIVKKLADLCRRETQMLSTTHKYIPIDKWCKSDVSEMQKAVKGLVSGIGVNEKWKMGINKRHWDKLHGTELVIKLTDVIDRPKVDLENPEKIVQVEIIGKETGISLLKPDEILDTARAKG